MTSEGLFMRDGATRVQNFPGEASTTSDPLRAFPCCCMRWQCPGSTEEIQNYTVVGRQANMEVSVRGWWSALGSVTTRSRGSW